MKRFQDLPIQGKLTLAMLLMLGVVLVLVGVAVYTYELIAVRQAGVADLSALAQVVAANSTAALRFDDTAAAQDGLSALTGNREIMAAGLYSAGGKLVAEYLRDTANQVPLARAPQSDGEKFAAGNLELYRKIVVDGEKLGTIYLRSDLEQYHTRLKTYALTMVGVAAVSLLVAFLLAAKVQRVITGPILELARLARTFTADKNYSLRAVRYSQDEIGVLTDALNQAVMMVEERELALQTANQSLQQRGHELLHELAEHKRLEVDREHLLGELRKANAGLRHLTRRVLTAQEDERRHISRELHDEAGQSLTVLKIGLVALSEELPADAPALRQRFAQLVQLTNETIQQVRTLAQDLRPPALDALPLDTCLNGYCREFAQRRALPVEYQCSQLPVLSDAVNICLYRVVQEALTNVAKHAHASRVRVELGHDKGMVRLSVVDDGKGFTDSSNPPAGVGLLGMSERLELLGGRLEITSQPGTGTQLVVSIPTENKT